MSEHRSQKYESSEKKKQLSNRINFSKIKEKTLILLKDHYLITFLIIFFAALTQRIKYFGLETLWNDAAVNLWWAQKLVQEPSFIIDIIFHDYTTINIPIAILQILNVDIMVSARVIALFYAMLSIVVIYLIASELKDKTTGLIAATLLSAHHLLWFYHTRILADAPLVTFTLLAIYAIIRFEKILQNQNAITLTSLFTKYSHKKQEIIWGITSAILLLFAVLTKRQAIVLPVIYAIYIAIRYRTQAINNMGLLYSWLIAFGLPMLVAIIYWPITGQNLLYTLFVQKLIYHEGIGSSLSVIGQLPWVIGPTLVIFAAIVGLLIAAYYKEKQYLAPIALLAGYGLWFEIGIGQPLDRYLLPLIPLGMILVATTISEIGSITKLITKNKWIKIAVIVALVILIAKPMHEQGTNLIDSKAYSYTGYQEASQWINKNANDQDILIAGSPRMMRAFTGREYDHILLREGKDLSEHKYLVNFRQHEQAENQTFWEEEFDRLSQEHDLYLEIDNWEYTQASWYYPITMQSLAYFESLGFEFVHVVNREVPTNEGMQDTSVIFIMKKSKQN